MKDTNKTKRQAGSKRAEEALPESEAKSRSMLKMANDAIISINSSGNVTSWNKAAQEMFGYTKDEVLGKPLTMLMPERYRNAHQRGLERVRSTGMSKLAGKRVEFPGLRKDGSEFPFELSLARWEAGGETFYTSIIGDITERKQVEQALMESEQNFRNSLDDSPLGIRIITAEGELLYANKAVLDIYGYSSFEELKFTPAKQRYTPESYAAHKERTRKRKVGEPVPPSYEISIVRKTGEIRTLQVFRKEVVWGGKTQFQSLYQDITEHKRAEEALVRTNRALKMAIDCMKALANAVSEPELLQDVCDVIVNIGGYCLAWVGLIEQGKAKPVCLIARVADSDRVPNKTKVTWAITEWWQRLVSQTIQDGKPSVARGILTNANFGTWRAEALEQGYNSAIVLPLKFRETFGILGICGAHSDAFDTGEVGLLRELAHDVAYSLASLRTQEAHKRVKTKMAEYEELNKLKSDLLSTVSHELRTPLATIKGYVTMLLDYDERIKPEEKRGCLTSIDNATDRLTELVDHLLDMSRIDAGLLKLEKTGTSISKLIEQTAIEAGFRAPRHKIVIAVSKELPPVQIDGKRIRQVLDNLIDNAVKFSEQGTSIVIEAEKRGAELRISVSDEGTGIRPEERELVFDRMYRIEQRLTNGKRGLGLGLSLCKRLVEAHGGRIWIEENRGKGTRCVFTLPL